MCLHGVINVAAIFPRRLVLLIHQRHIMAVGCAVVDMKMKLEHVVWLGTIDIALSSEAGVVLQLSRASCGSLTNILYCELLVSLFWEFN